MLVVWFEECRTYLMTTRGLLLCFSCSVFRQAASPRARPLSLACLKIYVSTLHHLRSTFYHCRCSPTALASKPAMLGPVVLLVTYHRPRLETDVLDELIFDLKEALPSLLLTLGTVMPPYTHTSTLPAS